MNLAAVFKAFDTVMAVREVAKRMKGREPSPAEDGLTHAPGAGGGQIEARLTNVVVAALKEAFARDRARVELEREQFEEQRRQVDEQRRRAEEAMRLEIHRQATDRELGMLRMLAATALVGWVASVAIFVVRIEAVSLASRSVLAAGWLLLLGALACAFSAQRQVGAASTGGQAAPGTGMAGAAALWLLTAGLAVSAMSLLFS